MTPASHNATVTLDVATAADSTLLANLLELGIDDLSATFPDIPLGPDGRFGYPHMQRYCAEPDRRFADLARADRQTAGFVLRRCHRRGVGGRAAALPGSRSPGRRTVPGGPSNSAALALWTRVARDVGSGSPVAVSRPGDPDARRHWHVLAFNAAALHAWRRWGLGRAVHARRESGRGERAVRPTRRTCDGRSRDGLTGKPRGVMPRHRSHHGDP